MTPAQSLPLNHPAQTGAASAQSPAVQHVRRFFAGYGRYVVGALVVAVAFVASAETRVLVMMLAMVAFVAFFAGPWSLRFWRLAQPSLFVEAGPPAAGIELAPRDDAIAAD